MTVTAIICEAYRSGAEVREIAEERKVTVQAVYAHLKRGGVSLRVPPIYDEDAIVRLYADGKSGREVAKILGIPLVTVQTIVKTRGLTRTLSQARQGHFKKVWSNEAEKYRQFLGEHESGMALYALAKKYGITYPTAKEWITRAGGTQLKGFRIPKSSVDETVFDKPYSDSGAYFIGLLATDGSLVQGEYIRGLSLCLHQKDTLMVTSFQKFLRTEYTVSLKSDGTVSLQVPAPRLHARLTEIGFTNRKSYDLEILDNDLLVNPHFLRGVIDGDGCLSSRATYDRIVVSSSSRRFIRQIQAALEAPFPGFRCNFFTIPATGKVEVTRATGFCRTVPHHKITAYARDHVAGLLQWLYLDNPGPVLERKLAQAKAMLRHIEERAARKESYQNRGRI